MSAQIATDLPIFGQHSVNILCPYCGHQQLHTFWRRRALVTCDLDAGGCDRDYVASLLVTHYATVQCHRIEGEPS